MRSFKIIFLDRGNAFKVKIDNLSDPLIVDIDEKKSDYLASKYKRNYIHVPALSNRGETIVVLKNKMEGTMRLTALISKARKFDRELVILYSDEKHKKYLKQEVISYVRRGIK